MEDIPPLAKHFIDLSVRELRSPKPRLTRAGITKLQSYDWPGNIRELRNVIDRAVILARGGALDFDLPGGEAAPLAASPRLPAAPDGENPGFLTESEIRERERDNLLAVLEKSGWKIKGENGAAELLGIKPTTLISRIKKLGLTRAA
jgi:DNA-binding NtrC family response regulator